MSNEGYNVYYSSSPVEVLHTVLLGCSKYMLRQFMDRKSADQKKEIMARIRAFPSCGLDCRVSSNISYFKSLWGGILNLLCNKHCLFLLPISLCRRKNVGFFYQRLAGM